MSDLLVLGSGVAGLSAAVRAARSGLDVVLLTKGETGQSATRYAQGGVAAALDASDSPELHLSDTLAAGGGLCDADAVRILCSEGPDRVRELIEMGAVFDHTGDGSRAALALAREGGHSTARVVHAGGDATGAEIERALVAALESSGVEVRQGWFATDLLVRSGRCEGVAAIDPTGRVEEVRARHTLMASGGSGQLYSVTTNPAPSTGDGTAMALRAAVPVADLEFVQFHPTALHSAAMPRRLLSEALRGEGAVLRDEQGVAFMSGRHPLGDLAPRDVVARAIAIRILERGLDHLWLDATGIPDLAGRFPTIHRACVDAGFDPTTEWLPVAPAAHYHCGGVLTDLAGATALPGLWAVGEAACAGTHGANRLASNSLLEGLVFAARAVTAVAAGTEGPSVTGALGELLEATGSDRFDTGHPSPPPAAVPPSGQGVVTGRAGQGHQGDAGQPGQTVEDLRQRLQRAMTAGAGVVRSAESLAGTLEELGRLVGEVGVVSGPEVQAVCNLLELGQALCRAALAREESRGAHVRMDFPEPRTDFLGRFAHLDANRMEFVPLSRSEARVT